MGKELSESANLNEGEVIIRRRMDIVLHHCWSRGCQQAAHWEPRLTWGGASFRQTSVA